MITKELILDFIDRAYEIACKHGFHDVELSDAHWLMLVLSEVGEMVEADRKGNWFKDKYTRAKAQYGKSQETTHLSKYLFEKYVKDTVDDELADVCIRLFDYCGVHGYELGDFPDGMTDEFERLYGDTSLCEQCFLLCEMIVDLINSGNAGRDIACALCYCFCLAAHHDIDLVWHVENKLRFNENRPNKHGKRY